MKRIFTLLFVALAAFSLSAQSSEKISEILESPKVTMGQVAYLAGTCGQGLPDESTYGEAFSEMQNRGFISPNLSADDEATLSRVACLLAKSTEMRGGIMFSIFKNERYAFKEFKARGIVPQNADPSMNLDGHDAFGMLNACLENQ